MKLLCKTIRSVTLAGALATAGTGHSAQNFSSMINSMQQMLDFFTLMNSLSAGAQTGLGNWAPGSTLTPNTLPPSWAQQIPGANPLSTLNARPRYGPYPYDGLPLDGYWLSSSGAVLAIRRGFARLYVSDSVFQDFYLRTLPDYVVLKNPRTDQTLNYKYAVGPNQLILRNDDGNILKFRRIIPPG